MTAKLRPARAADAEHVASLMTELGYPSKKADVTGRLARALHSPTTCCVVAESDGEVVALMCAELVPYFPTGATICRVTSLVVAPAHRRRRLGEKLIGAAADFAREHRCSGLEVTSAERRAEAHRFYESIGFSRTAFRFFRSL